MIMEKKRLTRILAKADRHIVTAMADDIRKIYAPVIVKEPAKTLTMIKVREPVKQSLFYIGEVIVCEAAVEIDGVGGTAVLMGDNTEKTLHIAIIDAAINKGVFCGMDTLLELENEQNEEEARENAMFLKTTVNFQSMDQEAPGDLTAFKKA